MITIVCWKWRPVPGYRSDFGASQVNAFYRMVERHAPFPHEVVCVTDDASGIDPRVRIVDLPECFGHLSSPMGYRWPSCYRRLRAFAPDAGAWLGGDRILSVDLDVVITGDLTPLVDREEDFVIWGDTAKNTPYNGGLWLLRAGTRPRVWTEFDPNRSPQRTKSACLIGSDQAWIGLCLGPGEARYRTADGVYSYRVHMDGETDRPKPLPGDARIVLFHGRRDPWQPETQAKSPWITEHWTP